MSHAMTDIPIPDDLIDISFPIAVSLAGNVTDNLEASLVQLAAEHQITQAIMRDRATQAEHMARLEEALRHVRSATYYPVSTEIDPKGWAWHMGPDGQEFVVETIEAALNFRPASAIAQEGSDA